MAQKEKKQTPKEKIKKISKELFDKVPKKSPLPSKKTNEKDEEKN